MCHLIVLCSTCNKCQKCCLKSACRGQTSKILANLAGSGCRSENSSNPEGGLHPSLSDPAKSHKVSHSHKLLCQSPQEQLPDGGITSAYRQQCSRIHAQSDVSRVFQPAVFGTQTQQVEIYTGPEQSKPLSQGGEIQNGDTGTIMTSLQQGEWVGSIDFKDAYFHIPIQEQSRKYLRFFTQGRAYQFKALPFGLSTAPLEFTVVVKEVKLTAMHRGIRIHQYLDDWLVKARSHQVRLQHTQDLVKMCQDLGWLVNVETSELEPKQMFDFVGYQFDLRSGPTDTGRVAKPSRENKRTFVTTDLPSPAVHVLDRFVNSHRETSSPRPTAYEAHTVASQNQLESARISQQNDSNTQVSAPSLTMVAGATQCARSTIAPLTTRSVDFHRRVKRRVGHSLKRAHCKRVMVSARKQTAYKLSGTKGSVSSFKRVPRPLCRQDSSSGHRQYNCSGLHKQRRRHEVGPTV